MHRHAHQLIPELAKWNNGAGIDLLSWVRCVGRLDHAIAYGAYFWPDFTVHDDCIFLHPLGAPSAIVVYDDWMRHCKGDRTAVERVMNHQHIADLFGDPEFEPTPQALVHLGRLLQEMWSCKLVRDFPERRVTVVLSGEGSEDLLDYEITLFQQRD